MSNFKRQFPKNKFVQLKVGDVVQINGMMYTGRDAIHKYLSDHDAPVDLKWTNHLSLWSCYVER